MSVVDELADHIVGLPRADLTRVAIDGRSAAGKSTLADAFAEALRERGSVVERGSIDDFHPAGHAQRSANEGYTAESYYAEAFDYSAFRRWVLAPRAVTVDVLLADGVFLLHPTLEDCWDLVIWVQIDLTTMIDRAVQRDVA
jgi:uridine kinase